MEEAEPLLRVLTDMGLILAETACAYVLNVRFVNLRIFRQFNCVEVDMEFIVFHIIDTGEHWCPGAHVKNSASLGAPQWLIEKFDIGTLATISLIEADNKQPVAGKSFLEGLHAFSACEMLKAGTVTTALANEVGIGVRVCLTLINEACWQAGEIEPGKICFKPATMIGGQDYSLSLVKGYLQFFPAGYYGISNQVYKLFPVQNKNETECFGKMQVCFFQYAYLFLVSLFRENCADVFVGDREPEREKHPGNTPKQTRDSDNYRNRQEVYKKYE